jgi:hypothetical protein
MYGRAMLGRRILLVLVGLMAWVVALVDLRGRNSVAVTALVLGTFLIVLAAFFERVRALRIGFASLRLLSSSESRSDPDQNEAAEFQRFTVEASPTLHHIAVFAVDDLELAEMLVNRALATVAINWTSIPAESRRAHALRALVASLERTSLFRTFARSRNLAQRDERSEWANLAFDLQPLPVAARAIAVLFFLEGMSEAEIAHELGRPLGDVETALAEARRLLEARRDHAEEESA